MLGLILLVGLLLRAAYLYEIAHEPDFAIPTLDPQFHDYWASGLVSGDWTPPAGLPDPKIPSTPYGRPPGYPYFLALVYFLSGGRYLVARVVQMLVGLVNAAFAFYLGKRLFGRVVGSIVAAFMAVYWGFIYFEGELSAPVVVVFLTLLLMHAACWWLDNPTHPRAFAVGLALGLLALFRSNVLLCGPPLVAWMAWVLWRRARFRRCFVAALLTAAGTLLVIAPVTIRNYKVSGEFFLITYNGGVNLYIGNNEMTDGVMPLIPEMRELTGSLSWTCFHYPLIMDGIARRLGKETITFGEANDYFGQKGWDFIRQQPGRAAKLVGKKALLFWGPYEITSNKVTHYAKRHSRVLRYLPGFPLVLALFVLGLVLLAGDMRRGDGQGGDPEARRRVVAMSAFILLFGFVYFASFLPFLVSGRFRVPLIPLLFLFGAYGVARVVQFARERRFVRAGAAVGAGAALCAVAAIPLAPYVPEKDYWHLQRAQAFKLIDELENAAAEYEQAIEAHGEFTGAMAHTGLAEIALRQGRKDDAIGYYREGLAIDPANPNINNNLGLLLAERGEFEAAVRLYETALRAVATHPGIHNNIATACAALKQWDKAVVHYGLALKLDPQLASAYCNLAIALAHEGEYRKAEALYNEGVRLGGADPDSVPTLGETLETMGEPDLAIELYHALFELDELNIKAYAGVANLFAVQGKLEEAVKHYLRVLEIDPSHREANFNLGAVMAAQGRRDEAIAYFDKCLELDPADVEAANHAGRQYALAGELDEAIRYYAHALENGTPTPETHNSMGNALAAQGKLDKAVTHYQAALEIDPADRVAYYNQARVLTLQGKIGEALESYAKALENYPDNARIHVNMAQLYEQQGRRQTAIEHYEAAIEIAPDNAEAKQGIERLRATEQE